MTPESDESLWFNPVATARAGEDVDFECPAHPTDPRPLVTGGTPLESRSYPKVTSVDTQNRIDEGALPSAAVRSTADHGVALRPNLNEEGSPMEAYVGLDVHSKRSVFVIEAEDGRVVARGDIPTTRTTPT